MTLPTLNLIVILPQIILVVTALIVLMADLVLQGKRSLGWLSFLAVLAALAVTALIAPLRPDFQTMALGDMLARVAGSAILIAAALALLLAIERGAEFTKRLAPYYALLLLATAGMLALVTASDFITIFIAVEILSLALYILVGFNRREPRSGEAALKYFLLGAFASGFLLYGMALIYAATGSTNLAAIQMGIAPLSSTLPFAPLLPVGIGLLLVGFGFKIALVPFHMWTPDVYQGAPTPVTAFMSVATKAAAFVALIRVLGAVITFDRPWLIALAVLAALTMTLGNLGALRQHSVKRMLAYSSIAHAGYVLTGLAAGNAKGAQGALFYLLAYTFMNLGAFAVLLAVQRRGENDATGDRFAGLAARQPVLAAVMAIFMFGLTGIPPLAGFFGKLYVFGAAVEGGLTWLAIIGVLNSAIAGYYYLRVTVLMVTAGSEGAKPDPAVPTTGPAVWVSVGLAALGTVVLGLWQWPWIQTITQAVAQVIR